MFIATAITLAATMPKNQRSSSFLNMGFIFLSSMKKYKLKFIENSSRNTLMTYSAYGLLYPAMLAFFTLKPPVPAVAKVLTSAS